MCVCAWPTLIWQYRFPTTTPEQDRSTCIHFSELAQCFVCCQSFHIPIYIFFLQTFIKLSDLSFHRPDYIMLLWNNGTCFWTYHPVHSAPLPINFVKHTRREETSQLPLPACSWASGMYASQLIQTNKRGLLSMQFYINNAWAQREIAATSRDCKWFVECYVTQQVSLFGC